MPLRILSLDGGGIRGLIAAKMLAVIEKQLNQPLNKYFDLIAGTSTGAILATAIATGCSSQEVIDLYRQKGKIIFPYQSRFSWKRLPLIWQYGISAPKFSEDGLIQVLQETFGTTRLFDISQPLLLVVAYDTINREPIIFKNWRKDKAYGNVPLWEVCVCSTSAPTYFPAHKLDKTVQGTVIAASQDTITLDQKATVGERVYEKLAVKIIDGAGKGQERIIRDYCGYLRQGKLNLPWDTIPNHSSTYVIKSIYSAIDGGVAANNPSSCAVAEAVKLGYPLSEISVLSLGTGDPTRVITLNQARSWGLLQWAQPLVGVVIDGTSDVNEYITQQIIGDRLLRLQFKLDRQLTGKRLSDDIDDVTPENINNLIEATEVYMNQPHIQRAVEKFFQTPQVMQTLNSPLIPDQK
ncbi:patatin-like phospholipase family protein [Calothrix sp. 336/3]|uniref:patatin-like phospholipase family protein n=1 Tax=Calothrix sp. 336/3 TaxID=1337936 RepID=UPI000624357B|nr:patatin-like phospholipase family protein [Calothrix sp. 336/3]AKG23843.1 patatin [Calothrix sp. 336/3]